MERTVITVREYCLYHPPVQQTFIEELLQNGLIVPAQEEEELSIPYDSLADLERLLRLHYDLEINVAGLETIQHLLLRMESLQAEIRRLRDYERAFAGGKDAIAEAK